MKGIRLDTDPAYEISSVLIGEGGGPKRLLDKRVSLKMREIKKREVSAYGVGYGQKCYNIGIY